MRPPTTDKVRNTLVVPVLIGFCLAVVISLSGCVFFANSNAVKYIKYPVRSGDTIASVAFRFDVSATSLAKLNLVAVQGTLRPGTILKIPFHGQSIARTREDLRAEPIKPEEIPEIDKDSIRLITLSSAKQYVSKLVWPVAAGQLSSKFGSRWFSFHEGIDIRAPEGTPFLAAHSGQVVYSGSGLKGYGKLIVVKAAGLLTVYAHNRRNEVKIGQWVAKGQKLGQVGQTGKATGPHLHFETRIKNKDGKNAAVDPLAFYP